MTISKRLARVLALGIVLSSAPSFVASLPLDERSLDGELAGLFKRNVTEVFASRGTSANLDTYAKGSGQSTQLFVSTLSKIGQNISTTSYPNTAAAISNFLSEPSGRALLGDFLAHADLESDRHPNVFNALRLVGDQPAFAIIVDEYLRGEKRPDPRVIAVISEIWRSHGRASYVEAVGHTLSLRFLTDVASEERSQAGRPISELGHHADPLVDSMAAVGGVEAQQALLFALIRLSEGSDDYYARRIEKVLERQPIERVLYRAVLETWLKRKPGLSLEVERILPGLAASTVTDVTFQDLALAYENALDDDTAGKILRRMCDLPKAERFAVEDFAVSLLTRADSHTDLAAVSVLERVQPERAATWTLLRDLARHPEANETGPELHVAALKVLLIYASVADNLELLKEMIREGSLKSGEIVDLIGERAAQEIRSKAGIPPAILGQFVLGESKLDDVRPYTQLYLELLNSPETKVSWRALELGTELFRHRVYWERLEAERRFGLSGTLTDVELVNGHRIEELPYHFERERMFDTEAFETATKYDRDATRVAERHRGEVLSREEQEIVDRMSVRQRAVFDEARPKLPVRKALKAALRVR